MSGWARGSKIEKRVRKDHTQLHMQLPLKIQNLDKKYGDFQAVKDMSFDVQPGEIFGLLGPNGAGKTSIISCIVTLQVPTAGSIQVFGQDPHKNPMVAKTQIGFVPQEIINHGYFSVYEILDFHSGFYHRQGNGDKIKYLLDRLGLWEHKDKKVRALSGGMKRRLLIAKALVHDPKLLLLDEPTAGVDIELRASLWSFVEELRQQGMSILLTTHYLEEAEQLCDRVGIIQNGQLKTVGDTKELIKMMTQRKITLTTDEKLDTTHDQFLSQGKGTYQFVISSDKAIGDLLSEVKLSMNQIKDIKIEEGSLEEAFIHVLGDPS